jgi:hypothetical protein
MSQIEVSVYFMRFSPGTFSVLALDLQVGRRHHQAQPPCAAAMGND